jgi:PAS domain S-box-containing protein
MNLSPLRHLPLFWRPPPATLRRVVRIDRRRALRQALLLGLLFSALLGVLLLLYYRDQASHNRALLAADRAHALELAAQAVGQELESVMADLRFLSDHNELADFLTGDGEAGPYSLSGEYAAFLRQKPRYDQLRFLDLAGHERIRVEQTPAGARAVPAARLQDKSGRYYHRPLLALERGRIYVSPLDLNVEHGRVEQPLKPVLRFGMAVYDPQGRRRGSILINYNAAHMIAMIRRIGGKGIRLLDPDGYWLMGARAEDEWGFMLPGRQDRRMARQDPQAWRAIADQALGSARVGERQLVFRRLYPLAAADQEEAPAGLAQPLAADRYYWILAAELDPADLGMAAPLARRLAVIYAVLVLLAFWTAAALSFAAARNRTLARVLEDVVDNVPMLVSYVDTEQRYRFNNLAYRQWFGLAPQDIYGKTMAEVLGEAAHERLRPHIEQALAGQRVDFESRVEYSEGGARDISVTYVPDQPAGGAVRGFYVVVADVTPLKDAQRREREGLLEHAHVSRLASMGEVTTEIAHQVNQPLAAIGMYSAAALRILQEGDGQHQQVREWLQAINSQAKRAAETVQRLRRFVRKGETEQGPVDLNAVVREMVALNRHDARAQQVDFDLRLKPDLPRVEAERILLEQVLHNLIRNALDASAGQEGPRRIEIGSQADAREVCVTVADSGPGVEAALAARIFDPFVTGKPDGLGIGLALCRTIVEAHGGHIEHCNRPEGGALFTVCLPRKEPP